MENKRFLTAQDVMEMLGVSLSYSYKLIRRLNAELEGDGFVTIKGRVSTQYFMKRIYGLSTDKEAEIYIPFCHREYNEKEKLVKERFHVHERLWCKERYWEDPDYPFDWTEGEFC